MTSDGLDRSLWVKLGDDPLVSGIVMRRVLPELPHDVFIGEVRPGRNKVLDLTVVGTATNMPKAWRQSKGLDVSIDINDTRVTKVRLRSLTSLGDPLFEELASDVVGTLASFPGADAATRVVERVIAWQEFFARRVEPFSEEEAAGLFGELTILAGGLIPALGAPAAVHGWTGPDPALQDFQFGEMAIEGKTYRGPGAGRMKISSERQLDHVGMTDLYVAYVSLDQRQDGTGQTLLALIEEARTLLEGSAAASHLFEGKLISCGWLDAYAEFRTEHYEIRSVEYFCVTDGFPRLVASQMPTGVGNVTYVVERSALDPYLVEQNALMDDLRKNQ